MKFDALKEFNNEIFSENLEGILQSDQQATQIRQNEGITKLDKQGELIQSSQQITKSSQQQETIQ
jgi:hypothetical protein